VHNARPPIVDKIQTTEKKILREIAIMKKCKHGQIVQLYEVINDRLSKQILLVMEYMGGGEIKWRDNHNRPILQVDQTRRICRDVVLGLLYLHQQGIIHRDIKPANLLWTDDRKNVKITDFGVSYFSTAERVSALRQNPAYIQAVARRKEERRRKEEEANKRKMVGWRRTAGSKDDIKGKSRASEPDPYSSSSAPLSPFPPSSAASSVALSSGPATPLFAPEDAVEAEIIKELEGELDPILIDDGGLSKQAGTPSFLAPEIIWDFSPEWTKAIERKYEAANGPAPENVNGQAELSQGRDGADMDRAPAPEGSSTPNATRAEDDATPRESVPNFTRTARPNDNELTIPDPNPSSFRDPNAELAASYTSIFPPRPPITKAIDVWALGVTLYCLLFGRTPWGGTSEYAMYQMIHTDDFEVDDHLGYDHIPSGGRKHSTDDNSEGAVIVRLLEQLLEKDCSKRITLDEVKVRCQLFYFHLQVI
jgi:serine/threonine protein kinase